MGLKEVVDIGATPTQYKPEPTAQSGASEAFCREQKWCFHGNCNQPTPVFFDNCECLKQLLLNIYEIGNDLNLSVKVKI